MNNDKNIEMIAKLLEQEVEWVKELNELLSTEKVVLATRQFEQLEDLAEKKQNISRELENSTKKRLELMGEDKTSPRTSLKEFIKKLNSQEASSLNKLNNQLAEQLDICRDLNTVNGQVIATNIHTRQEMLHVLSGNRTKDASVYTATGDIKGQNNSNPSHHEKA